MKKLFDKLPLAFCFLIAIAFSIKKLREPDLWWQIRTGEWILEHKQIPKEDVFSYTYAGAPWINIKWGFEVVAALIARTAGPECIFMLQAIFSCLIVFFLIKISGLVPIRKVAESTNKPLAIIISLLLAQVAMEYRINGRPEMFSHLFTVVFLFFLLRHRKEPSNKIFWLVPLQIVWANFHEAFGIGIVLTAIFCAGSWIEYYLSRKNILSTKVELPKTISLALLASVAAIVINPNGIKLLTRPLNILGQVYENKFTTELADIRSPEYWQWNVYWAIGLLGIGLLGLLVHYWKVKTKSNRFKLFIEQWGLGYLLTLLAFLFLAASAYRNIIFLMLSFFPLLVFGIDILFSKIPVIQKFSKQILIGVCTLQVAFYVLIVSGKYYELTKSHDRFGLEVAATNNPIGAAEFVQQNHLTGKCFSDYLTSSYLLWKLQPDFKTFIDLRDLDIFPSSFFTTFAEAVTYPESFERLDSIHQFNYVVLYRPQFAGLHDYLFNQSKFKLDFVDGVAAVYVRKASVTDTSAVINFAQSTPVSHWPGTVANYILNPAFKYTNATKVDNDLLAAGYYINVEKTDVAEKFAQKASTNNIENYKGKEMLGEVYYNKALTLQNKELKDQALENAKNLYLQSIAEKEDFSAAYYGLGAVYFQQGNMSVALENFDKSTALDKSNLNAYLFAAGCCNYYVNQNTIESNAYAERAIAYYRKADKLNPDNPQITLNLGFLYFRVNDCDKATKLLKNVIDFPGLTEQQRGQAKTCIIKCGQ